MGGAAGGAIGGAIGGGKGGDSPDFGSYAAGIEKAAQLQKEMSDKAIAVLQQQYQTSREDLSKYYLQSRQDLATSTDLAQRQLAGAVTGATSSLMNAQQTAQSYLNPYIQTGLPALDELSDLLGISRPTIGSLSTFQQQQQASQAQQQSDLQKYNQYQQQLMDYTNQRIGIDNEMAKLNIGNPAATVGTGVPGTANAAATVPTQQQWIYDPATGKATLAAQGEQGLDAIKQAITRANSALAANPSFGRYSAEDLQNLLNSNDINRYRAAINGELNTWGFGSQQDALQAALAGYRPATEEQIKDLGTAVAPNQPAYGSSAQPGAATTATPDMTASGSQMDTALQKFLNSPEYKLLFGNTATVGQTPEERYQQSADYKFAQQQGEQALARAASAKGYLNAPRYEQELMQYNSGLANQYFTQYQGQLANTFDKYKASIAAMAGMGQEASGASANLASGVGQGIANAQLGLGSSQAQVTGGFGQNIAGMSTGLGQNLAGLSQNLGQQVAGQYNQQGDAAANAAIQSAKAQLSGSIYNQQQNAQTGAGIGSLLGMTTGPGGLLSKFF